MTQAEAIDVPYLDFRPSDLPRPRRAPEAIRAEVDSLRGRLLTLVRTQGRYVADHDNDGPGILAPDWYKKNLAEMARLPDDIRATEVEYRRAAHDRARRRGTPGVLAAISPQGVVLTTRTPGADVAMSWRELDAAARQDDPELRAAYAAIRDEVHELARQFRHHA
jgi:hypothetical protein